MAVTGLENFMLTPASFRRLMNRKVQAFVSLRTYEVTRAVRRLTPARRLPYMAARADRWIQALYRLHPQLSFELKNSRSGTNVRRWSQLPSTLKVQGTARQIYALSHSPGVSSVYVTSIAGRRSRPLPSAPVTWYCVRALVIVRVERATSGNQITEDRFILVRASSFQNAKNRIKRQWRKYATPYLNSDGRLVSWSLDKVIDVFDTCETEIDPVGTEVYSKLGRRRMRTQYVWRPKLQ
jgi:hypothetical protein